MDPDDTPAASAAGEAPPAWVYSYNAGVEVEAAGRTPTKNWMTLRRDLAEYNSAEEKEVRLATV